MTKKKIAYALVRVSTNDQETISQRQSIIKVASDFGYTIPDDDDHVFGEKISGYDTYEHDRKSIADLKLHLQRTNEPPAAIFCSEVSRLSRNSMKVSKYVQELSLEWKIPMYFMDLKVWTIFIDGNRAGQEDRYAIQEIVGAAKEAERERDRIRERTKRGRDFKASKGYYVGHLVDGYTWREENGEKVIKIDEERRPVIERIFRLYIEENLTTHKIAQVLNADKVPTPQQYRVISSDPAFKGYKDTSRTNKGIEVSRASMKWTSATISNILTCSWYRGVRTFNSQEYSVEPYIDKSDSDAIEARSIEAMESKSTAQHFYLLSNIFFCGKCGRKLYGHYGGSQNHYYCSSKETGSPCGNIGINKENVEAIVWDSVRRYVGITMAHSLMIPTGVSNNVVSKVYGVFNIKENQSKISSEIKAVQQAIIGNNKEIDRKNVQIDYWLQEEASPDTTASDRQRMKKLRNAASLEINKLQDEQVVLTTKLSRLQKRLKTLKSTNVRQFTKYLDSTDVESAKQVVSAVVESVSLFNLNKSIKIIRVKFIDGKITDCIYSSYLLLGKVLYLPDDIGYDGVHSCLYSIRYELDRVNKTMRPHPYKAIDARDYILQNRETQAVPYRLLEQPTAKNLMYREREKEYRKKYNNGKIAKPHNRITKDELYELYIKERTHLYHRRAKIKKAKNKSEQEKEMELTAISERLLELRAGLKWYNLYPDEAVKNN